jgi:hypothetical protein
MFIRELEAMRRKIRTAWLKVYPQEPWTPTVAMMEETLATIQDTLRTIAAQADAAHQGPVRTSVSPAEKRYFNGLNFNAL